MSHCPRLLLLPLLLAATGCASDEPWARAYQAADLSETIGGPKALARPGDFILENDRIRLAILGTRPSLGPHTSGGSLADADLQRTDNRYLHGHGNDQLAEVFTTVNLNVAALHPDLEDTAAPGVDRGTVAIVSDGSDGGPAIVCVEGPFEPFIELLDGLWLFLGSPEFRIRTDYVLSPGVPAVLVRTVATVDSTGGNGGCEGTLSDDVPLAGAEEDFGGTLPIIELALETGMVFGDFYLQGGSVDVFAPEVGFDEEHYVYELAQEGVNTFEEPIPVDFLAGTADGVSYGLMNDEGPLFVPMFTSSQTVAVGVGQTGDLGTNDRFSDGLAYRYDRWFGIGKGDVGSALDALLEATGQPTGRIDGYVVEKGSGVALSDVRVFVYRPGADLPYSEWTTDIGDDPNPDGSFGGTLPAGDYELVTYATGRPLGQRVPVTVTQGGELNLVLESPQPGSLSFEIRDGTGIKVPAKLTVVTADGSDVRNTDLGDGYIGGQPAAVYFAPHGEGQLVLPPGRYQAIASRGIEYELDVSPVFTVAADTAVDLDLTVVQTVDTAGWEFSADFHVHAERSHDSGVSLEARVGTMVSEGVEFFASADHDAITDYAPVVEDLGLEAWATTAVGLEVTTIEIGHYLGFPLQMDHLADNGGAFDWTGMLPAEIVDSLRTLGAPGTDPVVFVGHPRDGILGYFDQYGLSHYDSDGSDVLVEPSLTTSFNPLITAEAFTVDFDALELLNGKRFEFIRTPLSSELAAYGKDPDSVSVYDMIERTMDEQEGLSDLTYTLGGGGHEGTIDDWFNLLNLGYRYTALGNSDTHGTTSTESGCPRNYVVSGTDHPGFADVEEITQAVREGRVITTYGPFLRVWANDDADLGPGTELVSSGPVTLSMEVQSPSWFDVERVEVYENGELLAEYAVPVPNATPVNFYEELVVEPAEDAWYVVIALGSDDLGPVFTPVDIPHVQLEDIVVQALSGIELVASLLGEATPVPRAFPIHPYGLTNPIWIDRDGDGFDAPGLPSWLSDPEAE